MSSKTLLFLLGFECGVVLLNLIDLIDDLSGAAISRYVAQAEQRANKLAAQAQVWAYIASGRTLKLLQEQRAKWAGDIAERMGTHDASTSDARAEESGSEQRSDTGDVYTELGE